MYAGLKHDLKLELLKLDQSGNAVPAVDLLKAVCIFNSLICSSGLSRKQMFTNTKHNEMNVSKGENLDYEPR